MVEFVTNLVELLMNLAHIPRSIGVLVVPIHAAHGAPRRLRYRFAGVLVEPGDRT